jgi:hypothetical protein
MTRATYRPALRLALAFISFGDTITNAVNKTSEAYYLDLQTTAFLKKELEQLLPNRR